MSMLGSLPGVVEVHVSMGEGKKPEDKQSCYQLHLSRVGLLARKDCEDVPFDS